MASTDQVREWYQETILNHDQRGTSGYEPQCDWRSAVTVDFPNQSGGHYSEPVHSATEDAWKVYVRLMEHHGVEMSGAGGVNQCRNIAGTNWPSLHAYLVACDLPPNSYKPQAFIDDVLRVRTNSGAQVFLNGAVFNDRMHDQINCSQSDLATGIYPTSLPFDTGDTMLPIDAQSDREDIRHVQEMLGVPATGKWDFDAALAGLRDRARTGDTRDHVNGRMYTQLLEEFIKRHAPTPDGGLTQAQVKALINDSQIIAP